MLDAQLGRLRHLSGVKWSRYGPEVIPSWVADMDFSPAPEVKSAMKALIDDGNLGYNPSITDAVVPAWLDRNEKLAGWRPPSEECFTMTGTLHALELALLRHTSPGDGVVLFTPIYYPFRHMVEANQRRVVDVQLHAPDWRLDAVDFASAVDHTTTAVFFCQPHNPLGRVFDAREIAGFAEVCIERDLLILNDEIWSDLVYEPQAHISICAAVPELIGRTVTVASASKTFNLAGLRCAVAHVGPESLREFFGNYPAHHMGAPSTIGCAATLAAWAEADGWLGEVREQLVANRELLMTRVADDLPGVTTHRPEATYLAWLDFSESAIAADPCGELLKRGKVALDMGSKFGPEAGSCGRLNFATSSEILNETIDRIAETLR